MSDDLEDVRSYITLDDDASSGTAKDESDLVELKKARMVARWVYLDDLAIVLVTF